MLEKEEAELRLSTPEEEYHISLQEQWELCFNKLMRLPQRHAGFFQKGKFERPLIFTTLPMEVKARVIDLEAIGSKAMRKRSEIEAELEDRGGRIKREIANVKDIEPPEIEKG